MGTGNMNIRLTFPYLLFLEVGRLAPPGLLILLIVSLKVLIALGAEIIHTPLTTVLGQDCDVPTEVAAPEPSELGWVSNYS